MGLFFSISSSKTTTKNKTAKDKTLTGAGNLIKLLPTGTVFLFQFLNPVFTNNGHCSTVNKYLSAILIGISVVSLLDTNSVRCFYPGFESTEKVLLQVLPPVIGAIASTVFVVFPNNAYGIDTLLKF
ncbi:hypothetical protein GBA52_003889 [Prunus armeniaca]|nr:hypothetical protein GBA52_003889 [Prunus armeniaca]